MGVTGEGGRADKFGRGWVESRVGERRGVLDIVLMGRGGQLRGIGGCMRGRFGQKG